MYFKILRGRGKKRRKSSDRRWWLKRIFLRGWYYIRWVTLPLKCCRIVFMYKFMSITSLLHWTPPSSLASTSPPVLPDTNIVFVRLSAQSHDGNEERKIPLMRCNIMTNSLCSMQVHLYIRFHNQKYKEALSRWPWTELGLLLYWHTCLNVSHIHFYWFV